MDLQNTFYEKGIEVFNAVLFWDRLLSTFLFVFFVGLLLGFLVNIIKFFTK